MPKNSAINGGPHSLTPKGARTRQGLLQAARQVFGEHGYSGASVSQISRECGLGQGTFYQYFRNKDQIFREVVDAALSDFWSQANALALEGPEPSRRPAPGAAAASQPLPRIRLHPPGAQRIRHHRDRNYQLL